MHRKSQIGRPFSKKKSGSDPDKDPKNSGLKFFFIHGGVL